MYACGLVQVSAGAPGGQERASESLELKLQAVVSHLPWVLEAEPRFSAAHYKLLTAEPSFHTLV